MVAQLALSVVLLISAGLLIRSFVLLQQLHPGFTARNLLTFGLTMTGQKYADRQTVLSSYRRLYEQLDSLPGVKASGGTTALPLTQTYAWTPITIEGRTPLPGEKFINADERIISGNYFQAMEIPLIRGRFFNEQDTVEKPRVTIIDESMARQFWPGQDPIGKRIYEVQFNPPWLTIVGVVGRVKHETLDSDPRIVFYLPHAQRVTRAMTVVMRASQDPETLAASVKQQVHALDPELPMYSVRTMEHFVDQSLARRRFSMVLLTIFSAIALALATIGVYGLMAFLVSQGTREIGIRIALGATQTSIVRLVIRRGMALSLSGVVLGIIGAFAFTRFMGSLLYGVTPTDILTFASIPLLLSLVALVATCIPARRAAKVEPGDSLRCE